MKLNLALVRQFHGKLDNPPTEVPPEQKPNPLRYQNGGLFMARDKTSRTVKRKPIRIVRNKPNRNVRKKLKKAVKRKST